MPAFNPSSVGGLFEGFGEIAFSFLGGFGELFAAPQAFLIIFTFLFVDFFDTAGTLIGVGKQANLLNEEGELLGGNAPLLSDSVGTVVGAMLGTSTVTSYVESTTGIEQGGRTGLTAVTVGILFLVSIIIFPILSVVNGVVVGFDGFGDAIVYSPVTSMALIMVGALMIGQLADLDWADKAVVVPSFLTIIFMMLAFSIAEGIAIGFIFYPITMLASKRGKEVKPIMYVLMGVFILRFILEVL
jgi:AGZA family xanthine/uracil permease-like MFS transporter